MTLIGNPRRRTGITGGPGIDTSGPPYPMPTAAPWNVPVKAVTPTYDGSGQAVHPSVVDMHHHTGADWNGWRYWMAHTPYTNTKNNIENPQIIVSQDGFHWYDPPGIRKPLYYPPAVAGAFLSDVDLDYDPVTNELVMAYRVYDGYTHVPHIVRSATGAAWPAISSGVAYTRSEQILAPSIVRVGTTWHMYGIGRDTRAFYRWTATDATLMAWTGPTTLTGLGTVAMPWHFDVQHVDGVYYLLIDRGPRYLTSEDGLRAATSTDGLAWTAAPADLMVKNAAYSWESAQLYRSCIQPHEDGIHFRLWYSTEGPADKWWTGYTQVRRDEWPTPA